MTRDSGKDHERIWLQSYEDTEALGEDRLWCEDKVWPNDPEDHEPTEYVRADLFAALEADLDAVTTYAAVLEAERDNARNDEWLAAISAVQFMSANWWQDCRSEVERNALQAVTEDVISALRSVGPTEYLDVQWKGAEAAMAAEEKAAALQSSRACRSDRIREHGAHTSPRMGSVRGSGLLPLRLKPRWSTMPQQRRPSVNTLSSTMLIELTPDGLTKDGKWQLVPKDPTEVMKVLGCEYADPLGRLISWDPSKGDCTTRDEVAGVYKAMLSAAPSPVTEEESEPCPVCGNEERGQGGYLSCECPAPSPVGDRDALIERLVKAATCALGHLTGNMDGDMDLGDPVEMLRAALSLPEHAEDRSNA